MKCIWRDEDGTRTYSEFTSFFPALATGCRASFRNFFPGGVVWFYPKLLIFDVWRVVRTSSATQRAGEDGTTRNAADELVALAQRASACSCGADLGCH